MSDLTLMIVNGDRYLLNTASKAVDRVAEDILKQYPQDACVAVSYTHLTLPTTERV